jgi:hypothetical protein
MNKKYKTGDRVVRKRGGTPFVVHISEDMAYVGEVVFDLYLNRENARDVEFEAVWNSPLSKAMREGKSKYHGIKDE